MRRLWCIYFLRFHMSRGRSGEVRKYWWPESSRVESSRIPLLSPRIPHQLASGTFPPFHPSFSGFPTADHVQRRSYHCGACDWLQATDCAFACEVTDGTLVGAFRGCDLMTEWAWVGGWEMPRLFEKRLAPSCDLLFFLRCEA